MSKESQSSRKTPWIESSCSKVNHTYKCRWKDATMLIEMDKDFPRQGSGEVPWMSWRAGLSSRLMLTSDQSHLRRKRLSCQNLNSLFYSPTSQTLEIGSRNQSRFGFKRIFFFLFRERDLFRLWPESILSCEEFPKPRQGVVSGPGTGKSRRWMPGGIPPCITPTAFIVISTDQTPPPRPTAHSYFQLENLLRSPCKCFTKSNMQAIVCEDSEQRLRAPCHCFIETQNE